MVGIITFLTSCTEIFKTDIEIQDCSTSTADCSYAESVQPIFDAYCISCHSTSNASGNLNLESYVSLMSNNVVSSGDSLDSILWQRLIDPNSPMPPDGILDDYKNIHIIAKWIESGAINN